MEQKSRETKHVAEILAEKARKRITATDLTLGERAAALLFGWL